MTAEAWGRGGVEAEKIERSRQRACKKATEERRHKASHLPPAWQGFFFALLGPSLPPLSQGPL